MLQTGITELDKLLGGSIPPGYSILIINEIGVKPEFLINEIVFNALSKNWSVGYFCIDQHAFVIRDEMKRIGFDISRFEKDNQLRLIDACCTISTESKEKFYLEKPRDVNYYVRMISSETKTSNLLWVFDSLSTLVQTLDLQAINKLMSSFSDYIQSSGQIALYRITAGMHDSLTLSTLQHFATGAIYLGMYGRLGCVYYRDGTCTRMNVHCTTPIMPEKFIKILKMWGLGYSDEIATYEIVKNRFKMKTAKWSKM